MQRVLGLLTACFMGVSGTAVAQMKEVTAIAWEGATAWPLIVAQEKGFLAESGLILRTREVEDHAQMAALIKSGSVQLIMTAYDNLLAGKYLPEMAAFVNYAEDGLALMARPGITDTEELRGKMLGVDDPDSGFALAAYAMLAKEGLKRGDYQEVQVGGTMERFEALLAGKIDAALVTTPFDTLLAQQGFEKLEDPRKTLDEYQTAVIAAPKDWLADNRKTAEGFARAHCRAMAWLADDDNKEEAVALLIAADPELSPEMASGLYQLLVQSEGGFSRDPRLDEEALETVHEIRKDVTGKAPEALQADLKIAGKSGC